MTAQHWSTADSATERGAEHPASTYPPAYPGSRAELPTAQIDAGRYEARFAHSREDLDQVLRLRFEVFNLELGEGLDDAYITGRDEDAMDVDFHHLMITCRTTGTVVGTYRMQTAEMAERNRGFYSAAEFDLTGLPDSVVASAVEIGRACVRRDHRNGRVLHLLWRGLAEYLAWNRKNYLFGCCSLTSQNPALGVSVYQRLARENCVHPTFRVEPIPQTRCAVPPFQDAWPEPHIPALFQTYLRLGAKVCGPPALDVLFKTIDFLVLIDVLEIDSHAYMSFFR